MRDYNSLDRILVGIKRNPRRFLVSTFVAYASIWTILEPILGIIPQASEFFTGLPKYLSILIASVMIGVCRTASPREVLLKHNNSVIRITFGDLFSLDGLVAIPVSRFFFETEVVETSLQNAVIRRFIHSEEGAKGLTKYKESLSSALNGKEFDEIPRKAPCQKERFYPLGTTALLELEGKNYLLFAVTQTELKGSIPHDNCRITDLWLALQEFWREARIHARGKPVNLPLVGSGAAGISLTPTRILEINLLAVLNSIVEGGKITTGEIRVVLHHDYFKDIDLGHVKNIWK